VKQTEEQTPTPGRERILSRLRAALNTSTQSSRQHVPRAASGRIFAPIPDVLDRFQRECANNNTECIVTPDARASAAAVTGVLASLPHGEVFVQDAPPLRRMAMAWQEERAIRWSREGAPEETSQATVTLAEVLVAETGSVFVSAGCGGRGASVVAPAHIVVASHDQLVPDLELAFSRLRARKTPAENSFMCLITGPSRTGDIEKIQVLGAHGPQRLIVVLAQQTV
jgi:L-lactate utilization protein LutC